MPDNAHDRIHWMHPDAWREILARIFEGFDGLDNVSPAWLRNPETGRQLKLDRLYPEVGIAFRFLGLQGAHRSLVSEEELAEEAGREEIRAELCRQAGVTLITIDTVSGEPRQVLRAIRSALSHVSRALAQSTESHRRKVELAQRIAASKKVCDQLYHRVRDIEDLAPFVDSWRDREANTPKMRPRPSRCVVYQPEMIVTHTHFGAGVVRQVERAEDEVFVTVEFANGTQRRFAASLVGDKLIPV